MKKRCACVLMSILLSTLIFLGVKFKRDNAVKYKGLDEYKYGIISSSQSKDGKLKLFNKSGEELDSIDLKQKV